MKEEIVWYPMGVFHAPWKWMEEYQMKKKLLIIGALLALGAATLTGCGPEKTVGDQQVDLAKNLIDKANDAVDNANQTNPDSLLDIKGE